MIADLSEYTYFLPASEVVEAGGANVMVRRPSGTVVRLRHYEYHSPDGFQYGYGGSGPADLALAILAHALGERPTKAVIRGDRGVRTNTAFYSGLRCLRQYQDFKWAVIAKLPKDEPFEIAGSFVKEWLDEHIDPLIIDQGEQQRIERKMHEHDFYRISPEATS